MQLDRRLFLTAQLGRGLLRDHEAEVDPVLPDSRNQLVRGAKRDFFETIRRLESLGQLRRKLIPKDDILQHFCFGFLFLLYHEPDQQVQQQRNDHDRKNDHQQQGFTIPQDVLHLLEKDGLESSLHVVAPSFFGLMSLRNALSKNDSPVCERIASTPPSKQSLPSWMMTTLSHN